MYESDETILNFVLTQTLKDIKESTNRLIPDYVRGVLEMIQNVPAWKDAEAEILRLLRIKSDKISNVVLGQLRLWDMISLIMIFGPQDFNKGPTYWNWLDLRDPGLNLAAVLLSREGIRRLTTASKRPGSAKETSLIYSKLSVQKRRDLITSYCYFFWYGEDETKTKNGRQGMNSLGTNLGLSYRMLQSFLGTDRATMRTGWRTYELTNLPSEWFYGNPHLIHFASYAKGTIFQGPLPYKDCEIPADVRNPRWYQGQPTDGNATMETMKQLAFLETISFIPFTEQITIAGSELDVNFAKHYMTAHYTAKTLHTNQKRIDDHRKATKIRQERDTVDAQLRAEQIKEMKEAQETLRLEKIESDRQMQILTAKNTRASNDQAQGTISSLFGIPHKCDSMPNLKMTVDNTTLKRQDSLPLEGNQGKRIKSVVIAQSTKGVQSTSSVEDEERMDTESTSEGHSDDIFGWARNTTAISDDDLPVSPIRQDLVLAESTLRIHKKTKRMPKKKKAK